MTGFVVICMISVVALAFCGAVLEQRVNALKCEVDELRRQLRTESKAERKQV